MKFASFGIGYLMPLWTKHSQTLHDKMTETFVTKN